MVSACCGNPFAVSSKRAAMRRQDQVDVQLMQPIERSEIVTSCLYGCFSKPQDVG